MIINLLEDFYDTLRKFKYDDVDHHNSEVLEKVKENIGKIVDDINNESERMKIIIHKMDNNPSFSQDIKVLQRALEMKQREQDRWEEIQSNIERILYSAKVD